MNLENNNKIIKILKNEIFNINNSEMRNKIYEIYIKNKKVGKGFITRIKDNKILIINNNIIEKEEKIIIKKGKEEKEIEIKDRMKYINKEYNINIIEIKEEDNIKNYIELDDDIDKNFNDKTIYVLDEKISCGKIKEIEKNKFKYECYIENNIKGIPIINIINNKLIEINNINNKGIFITNIISEFMLN